MWDWVTPKHVLLGMLFQNRLKINTLTFRVNPTKCALCLLSGHFFYPLVWSIYHFIVGALYILLRIPSTDLFIKQTKPAQRATKQFWPVKKVELRFEMCVLRFSQFNPSSNSCIKRCLYHSFGLRKVKRGTALSAQLILIIVSLTLSCWKTKMLTAK